MGHSQKKPHSDGPKQTTKDKLREKKKERKLKLKEKRARLIIRNLPFETTKENLSEHFAKFGELQDVELLKKEDGKMVGCGFVQFKFVQKAAKAKHHTDNKPFLGRDISVDFALSKNKFKDEQEKLSEDIKIKEEPIDNDETKDIDTSIIKAEDLGETKTENVEEKAENPPTVDDKSTTSDSDSELDEDDVKEDLSVKEGEPSNKRARFESNDVTEGKTIFVKNVPFQATNDDLKSCMRQYGPVYYALICMDKYTEHSKGTAFVKFVNSEDAEEVLRAGTELTLLGNILDCHRALNRTDISQKSKTEEKTVPKDSRNLYLVKEGVILAGTKAAEGVSGADMAKRLQLEQYKTQMLRNLNMFVAHDRLIIHNLPPSWDDKKLRILVLKHAPKNAQIKETKIMRDLKHCDEKGVGRSKEYGFVSFNRHEDAIAVLRSLNNNPGVFSAMRRPIVAFSIENRTMLKAKQKRLEKSRTHNPTNKKAFDAKAQKATQERRERDGAKRGEVSGGDSAFSGVAAKPGKQKMRSRFNLKTQAALHHENLKKEKKQKKFAKKSLAEKKRDFTKQDKQKRVNKEDKDNFSKLVANYKQKLTATVPASKGKWYE